MEKKTEFFYNISLDQQSTDNESCLVLRKIINITENIAVRMVREKERKKEKEREREREREREKERERER